VQEEEQDRTEQATPFKLEESRKRGEVQRSMEVGSFALVAALLLGMLFWGTSAWERVCRDGSMWLAAGSEGDALPAMKAFLRETLEIILPFGIAGGMLAALSNLAQTGPIFTFHPLKPRFERIDPIKGFRRLFSKRLLFEAVKSLVKIALLGGAAYLFFADHWREMITQSAAGPGAQLVLLSRAGIGLLEHLAFALFLIAALDVLFVRWQYRRQMMMSRRELREEVRRREGDPRVRTRQRELQRENRKQSRSLKRIGDADVLITNPDHVGVALRYEPTNMSAPHVLAKGAGLWVGKMKILAWRHGVPVREIRPLARQLFRLGTIDRPIPPDAYLEVARLYAQLDAERKRARGRYEVWT
jgi:flagellar biosynthetic protein FlhB